MINNPAISGRYKVCSPSLHPWDYNAADPQMSGWVAPNGQPGAAAHYASCVPGGQYEKLGNGYTCCAGFDRNQATGLCE